MASENGHKIKLLKLMELFRQETDEQHPMLAEDVSEYTEQAFKMYGGDPVDIVIEYDEKLIGVVYDKFGEGTKMMRSADDKIIATVKVQIAPTFWGWLFQFGGQMKILSPDSVKQEYKKQVAALIDQGD